MRLLGVFLCVSIASAQHPRDSWKLRPIDLDAHLEHTLADAPLSSADRARLYRLIDDDERMHGSFSDSQPDEERKMIMSTRIGSIVLADSGSKQILAAGPDDCNGAANQCIRIFVRQRGRLLLALDEAEVVFTVLKSSSKGFHDITVGLHLSAWDTVYHDYQWDGNGYKQVDCYVTKYDRNGDFSDSPKIAGCS